MEFKEFLNFCPSSMFAQTQCESFCPSSMFAQTQCESFCRASMFAQTQCESFCPSFFKKRAQWRLRKPPRAPQSAKYPRRFFLLAFSLRLRCQKKVAKGSCLFQGGRTQFAPTINAPMVSKEKVAKEFRLFQGGRPMVASTVNFFTISIRRTNDETASFDCRDRRR